MYTTRRCYACDSDQTYIRYDKNLPYAMFYLNRDTDNNVLCHKCYVNVLSNPRRYPNKYIHPRIKTHLGLKQYHQAKERLFDILGRICVKCGYNDIRILQFDHINGGGNADQKRFSSNYHMYRYYVIHADEAKLLLQVLCPNCNWIKRVENKEFPNHLKKSKREVKLVRHCFQYI